MTAVHQSLNPACVTSCNESEEILTIEATVNDMKIRFMNGSGPQETSPEEKRRNFFQQLDLEIKKAILANAHILIEMDSNAKLGEQFIPGDPKPQSAILINGMLCSVEAVLCDEDLTVLYGCILVKRMGGGAHGIQCQYNDTERF